MKVDAINPTELSESLLVLRHPPRDSKALLIGGQVQRAK